MTGTAPPWMFSKSPQYMEAQLDWDGDEVDELLSEYVQEEPDELPSIDFLKFLVEQEAWMALGTCKVEHADPSLFILDKGCNAAKGREYCRRCPVRQDCLDYALRTGSVGIWGGELLGLSHREDVELSDMSMQDARPVHLEYLDNPLPLQQHQIPPVIFFK